MTVYQGNDVAFDWDVTEGDLDEGPRFRTLEPGYYPFTVQKLERTRYDGSAKIPPCPMAKVTLRVQDADGTEALTSCRLFLVQSMMWKVTRFMAAVGQGKDANGKTVINWGDVEGRNGWLKLSKRSYRTSDGQEREANDVDEFCLPDEQQRAYEAYEKACDAYEKACAAMAPRQQAQQPTYGAQGAQAASYAAQPAYAPQNGAAAPQAGYQQAAMPGMPAPQPQQGAQHPGWGIQ